MKNKFTLLSLALFLSIGMFAQAPPQKINYQAVARDLSGNPLISSPLTVIFDVRQGSGSGTVVYSETHNLTTNQFGLFTSAIGGGTPNAPFTLANFAGITWGSNMYFLQVTINGDVMPSTQLLSVPYALHAGSASTGTPGVDGLNCWDLNGNGAQDAAEDINGDGSWDALDCKGDTGLAGINGIGINWLGTFATNPASPNLNDAYYNSTDGKSYIWDGATWQTLAQDGAASSLTAGTGIDITTGVISNTGDLDSTNELITSAILNGTTLEITEDGVLHTISLASLSGSDNWGTDTVNTLGANILGSGTVANPLIVIDNDTSATNELELPMIGNTIGDVLKWNGSAWVNANDSVDDADNDPLNEIELPATAVFNQVLTWNGSAWVAQNPGSGADNWGSQVVITDGTLSGDGTSGNPLSVTDNDTSSTNELQNLSISGNTINISNGTGISVSTNFPTTGDMLFWNGSDWTAQPVSGININDADADSTNEYNTNFTVNAGNLEITDAGGTLQVPLSTLSDGDWTVSGSDLLNANTGNVGIGVTTNFNPGSYNLLNNSGASKVLTISSDPDGLVGDAVSSLVLEGSATTVGYETGVIDFVNTAGSFTRYNYARIAATKQNTNNTYGALRFYTRFGANLTEKMIIDENGNVGIGTTTPTTKLHLNNNNNLTGMYSNTSFLAGTAGHFEYSNLSGGAGQSRAVYAVNQGNLTDNYGVYSQVTGGSSTNSYGIYSNVTGGTNRWSGYFAAGNVYIADNLSVGTTSAFSKLDVNGQITMRAGATNGYIPVSDANGTMTWTDPLTIPTLDDGDWIRYFDGTNNHLFNDNTHLVRIFGPSTMAANIIPSTNLFEIYANNSDRAMIVDDTYLELGDVDGGQFGNKLIIDPEFVGNFQFLGGNVGIGTTNPIVHLDVTSSSTSGTGIQIRNTDTGGKQYRIVSTGTGSAGGAGLFQIWDQDNTIARLTVNSLGNVGIGTTSPVVSLDVYTNTNTRAGQFVQDFTSGSNKYGIYSLAQGAGAGINYGVTGEAINSTTTNIGIRGSAFGGPVNWAGYFDLGDVNINNSTYIGGNLLVGTVPSIQAKAQINGTGYSWAFKILGGGSNTQILGVETGTGNTIIGNTTSSPGAQLEIVNATASVNGTTDGILNVGQNNTNHLTMDGNEIQARTSTGTSNLYLNYWGSDVSIANSSGSEVGIGNIPSTAYKLYVNTSTNSRAGQFYNSMGSTGVTYGLYASSVNGTAGGESIGLYGRADGSGNYAYGVYGYGTGGATAQYGVYSLGNAYSSGSWLTSDRRLKKDIHDFNDAIDKLNQLPVKTYFFDNEKYDFMNLSKVKQYGIMAQDLEIVFPEMVMEGDHAIMGKDGNLTDETISIKTVNYDQLIPVLVKAVQEQQQQIEDLKKEVEELKNK